MEKSPAVAYFTRKIKTTGKAALYAELQDAPLTNAEHAFICDIYEGLSIDELAEKHSKSNSRISKWKRELFERLLIYENTRK